MMLIPWGPSAVPTGGAGFARPAGIWSLTNPVTFFAIVLLCVRSGGEVSGDYGSDSRVVDSTWGRRLFPAAHGKRDGLPSDRRIAATIAAFRNRPLSFASRGLAFRLSRPRSDSHRLISVVVVADGALLAA